MEKENKKNTLNTLAGSIDKLSKTMNARFDVVDNEIKGLKTDVSVLKTDVSVLKTDVSVLKTDVSVLKTKVNTIDKKLNKVDRTLAEVKRKLITSIEEHTEADLETRVVHLEEVLRVSKVSGG